MNKYTRFRNKNRGYMKLRVWHPVIDLYKYEAENNLWKLLESLEKKRDDGSWVTRASDNIEDYDPE